MSMHASDYLDWAKDHPIVVAVVVTAVATGIAAALFWNAVL